MRPVPTPQPEATRRAPAQPAMAGRAPLWHRVVAAVLKTLAPLLLLAAAFYGYREITATPPSPERAEPGRVARLVEVTPARPATRGPVIEAWGEVVAPRVLGLEAEASGAVAWVSPALAAGSEIAEGAPLFRVDTRELELTAAEAEARIAEIDARIMLERGQAARAAADLARRPTELTDEQRALVLREPQMNQLLAERRAAVAVRDRARLAAERAERRAPFDAVVIETGLSEGQVVGAGEEVARLAATDAFEVRLSVPVTSLSWLPFDAPEAGRVVRLTQPGIWPDAAERRGVLERRAPALRETGRMAEVIVRVTEPLASAPGRPALLLGSFLRAEIPGRPVEQAVALPRRLLRGNDTVWIKTADDRLDIRAVEVVWRGADSVLVTGIEPGAEIVTTDIAVVADGMALRTDAPGSGGAAE